MPTDKPYRVAVRIQQHERPTRRVPPLGTAVGQDALAVVIREGATSITDIDVLSSSRDGVDLLDSGAALSIWLALGAKLYARAQQNQNDFELLFYDTILSAAATILENPQTALMARYVSTVLADELVKLQEEAVVKQAQRSSSEGKN